jgi:hypothetical protein
MNDNPTHTNHRNDNGGKPIAIEVHRWLDLTNGRWRSCAFVKLTSALRTSGLLLALPAEELKNLLCLLTFTTSHGDCLPSVHQLAHAMQVSEEKARQRMERLAQLRWQGKPLVTAIRRGNGMDAYTVASGSPHADAPVPAHSAPDNPSEPDDMTARLERPAPSPSHTFSERKVNERPASYTSSERKMNERPAPLHPAPDAPPFLTQEEARGRLMQVGVEEEWADYLIANYDLERIQRQLDWLPYRTVREPARFIVSAIERDYEEPFALRRKSSGEPPAS